jgi:hypothetical protein
MALVDEVKLKYCKCNQFIEQGEEMPKEKKAKKSDGRKPTLAPFIDGAMNIFATYKKKEYEAKVRADGVIVYKDKEYATPSLAALAIVGKEGSVNGWVFWRYTEGGKDLLLNKIRGSKSPLKLEASKPKKVKAAAPKKPKSPRKPRAKKSKANGHAADVASGDGINANEVQSEATA